VLYLAWRNLIKDPVRLTLTLVGVAFAVVLISFNLGAYFGFVRAFSVLIDNSRADIWITLRNNVNFDAARPFSERKLWTVRQVNGVEWAEPVIKGWSSLKLASGGTETVMVVGSDPQARIGWPWKMREGRRDGLKEEGTIIVDESAVGKLGGIGVGDQVEVLDTRMRVVGISEEVRSFTTYPVVFTRYDTARRLAVVYRVRGEDQLTFIVAKVRAGVPIADVVERLRRIPDVDVYTTAQFSWNTRMYWIVQTGIGIGFGLTALLGFLVGMIIVGQTIYASTLEHLREFGTLKALGARNRDLLVVILSQALLSALGGFLIGHTISNIARRGYERFGLVLVSSPELTLAMLAVTVLMCVVAAVLPLRAAFSIDPATVFRA
jgi:putative ABC transport system permease protein